MTKPYTPDEIKGICSEIGLKYRTISEMLGYTPESVANMLWRCRKGKTWNFDDMKYFRFKLLMTYLLNEYICEHYGEDGLNEILAKVREKINGEHESLEMDKSGSRDDRTAAQESTGHSEFAGVVR